MSTLIVLDTGPLGQVTNPRATAQTAACHQWLEGLLARGVRVEKRAGLRRLDALVATVEYLPLTTAMMRHAAGLWAEARRQGRPTADDKALDGDVILAAQVLLTATEDDEAIVATENVGHLARFVTAYPWWDIH